MYSTDKKCRWLQKILSLIYWLIMSDICMYPWNNINRALVRVSIPLVLVMKFKTLLLNRMSNLLICMYKAFCPKFQSFKKYFRKILRCFCTCTRSVQKIALTRYDCLATRYPFFQGDVHRCHQCYESSERWVLTRTPYYVSSKQGHRRTDWNA